MSWFKCKQGAGVLGIESLKPNRMALNGDWWGRGRLYNSFGLQERKVLFKMNISLL